MNSGMHKHFKKVPPWRLTFNEVQLLSLEAPTATENSLRVAC